MHLKQKGYCCGVLLISTITTVTLPSVGRCGPAVYSSQTHSYSALGNDGDAHRAGPKREAEPVSLLHSSDGTRAEASLRGAKRAVGPKMASTSIEKRFKKRNKAKQTKGQRTSPPPPPRDCSGGSVKHIGSFYMNGRLEANLPHMAMGYQPDSAAPAVQAQEGPGRTRGQRPGASEGSWQRLQPVVECGDDAMTLTVRKRRASQLLLDRANESSVPLSQLPPECGYSVQTTWRDLSLMAQHDACHVTQEDDRYMLPLLWRGTPVKMSCPISQTLPVGPSALCCSPYGMTVKVQGHSAAEELTVNVRGEWTPLETLAEQCGYTLDRADEEIVIAAPFITCGITVKDGKYTLSLQAGEMTFTLACPVSPANKLPPARQPLVNSPLHLPRKLTEHVAESLEPLPWAPPFYLAPPYYPHPTYRHKHLSPDGNNVFNTPTPSPLTPDPAFGPQPLPHVDSQPGNQDYKHVGVHSALSPTHDLEDPDVQQQPETPIFGLFEKHGATHTPPSEAGVSGQVQAEASPHQSPHHAFSQYYHYYHHPKIPLLDPGPEAPREQPSTNPHNLKFPVLPPSIQQTEALRVDLHQSLQPAPEAASHPHTLPSNAPYPPQPYPYPYFYYSPLIARGEAKRAAPLNPETAAKTNLSDHDNTMLKAFAPQSGTQYRYDLNPYIDQPKSDKILSFHPLLDDDDDNDYDDYEDDDDVKAGLDDRKRHSAVSLPLPPSYPPGPDAGVVLPPKQSSFPTAAPSHNLPPYPYHYHPYYHYYQLYYRPESLHGASNLVSTTSSKESSDPLLQTAPPQNPSHHKHPTTAPTTASTHDVHSGGLHPYYYYYHPYYQPETTLDNQELHPTDSMNSKSESLSDSDHSQMDWQVPAAQVAYPSIPQPGHSPFHSLHSLSIAQQQLYDSSWHPGGEEAERLDKDRKADCAMGQYLIFAVPESVVEPSVAPSAHPSEVKNVSCTMQKLTSDPDIYIVPLDSCRGSEHVSGHTVVHPLQVCGIHFLQQEHSTDENSPVRLMVECSSSPGSPGGVRLHVTAQPPPPPVQSAPAAVMAQLRIATDESFTSFHPEARLPLSLLRGRPVYLEVSLLDPPEPSLVLLVHSCLAYTQAPHTGWMPVYDGCLSGGESQLLPSARSHHKLIQRILVSSFLSLPSASPSYTAEGRSSHQEDPEIYFLCLTKVCSPADDDCTAGCINSPNSHV